MAAVGAAILLSRWCSAPEAAAGVGDPVTVARSAELASDEVEAGFDVGSDSDTAFVVSVDEIGVTFGVGATVIVLVMTVVVVDWF